MDGNPGVEYVRSLVKQHPNFPIPGILFHDVFPVFQEPRAVEIIITNMLAHLTAKYPRIDAVVGLDARGFLFGPILAMRLSAAFVPVRKAGKLPGTCIRAEYTKEYGKDVFEMQEGAVKPGQVVVIVDDLLATGGTMACAVNLVRKAGANVVECLTVVGMPELNGTAKIDVPCFALMNVKASC
eukprot:m.55924 g.55924  ORF g.55924 m.55924 type:complete len:183 (+) comp13358_c0_seq1:39-587(+)